MDPERGAYAVQQVGRSLFMAIALRGPLRRTFQRILVWCVASGSLAVAGGLAHGAPRGVLWLLAYTLIHPIMVAGIIVSAAGDEKILTDPSSTATTAAAWMILGGPALFLAGHAAFKAVVWRVLPWPRMSGIAALALLALAAGTIPQIALAAAAAVVVAVVVAAVAACEQAQQRSGQEREVPAG